MTWLINNLSSVGSAASIIGTLVSIFAFWAALCQISKTKKAAESARDSAKETLQRIGAIEAVVMIEQNCVICMDLLNQVRESNFKKAVEAATQLRNNIARLSESIAAANLQNPGDWKNMLMGISQINMELERAARIDSIDSDRQDNILEKVGNIASQLNALAAKAGNKAGENYANSKCV